MKQPEQYKTRQRFKIDFIPIFDIVQKDRLIIKNTHLVAFGDLFYHLRDILNVMQTVNPSVFFAIAEFCGFNPARGAFQQRFQVFEQIIMALFLFD